MSYSREIAVSLVFGFLLVGVAFVAYNFADISDTMVQIILGVGVVLIWLALARSFFRFMWFGTKQNESNLYGGMGARKVRRSKFSRWFMGLDADGKSAG